MNDISELHDFAFSRRILFWMYSGDGSVIFQKYKNLKQNDCYVLKQDPNTKFKTKQNKKIKTQKQKTRKQKSSKH